MREARGSICSMKTSHCASMPLGTRNALKPQIPCADGATLNKVSHMMMVMHLSVARRVRVRNVPRQSHIGEVPPGIANIAIQEQQRACVCIGDQPPDSERSSALLRL